MSFAIDVNILLFATDQGSPFHRPAREFIESCVRGNRLFYLAWPTIMGYLRIATHPAIFDQPLTPEEAVGNMERLLHCPYALTIGEDDRFWNLYLDTTRSVPTRGNLVPDAHLATLLRQHGITTIYTHDRDYLKFDFLQVVDPVVPRS